MVPIAIPIVFGLVWSKIFFLSSEQRVLHSAKKTVCISSIYISTQAWSSLKLVQAAFQQSNKQIFYQGEGGNKIPAFMSQQRLPFAWVNFVSVEKLLISLKLILEDILSWVITTLVRNFNYCNRSHNISHLCPLLYSSVHLHLCSTLLYKIQRYWRRFNPWLFTHLTFCLEKDLVKLKIELTNNGAMVSLK